ncbi:MAG: SHOCT domain-containing protein [Ignavibacterium sp.]|jgi:putative membrane protein|uniref:SHOCT domain-containing protein n=1 Tax=Ignavibacterium sp. TaxID=2651167 RepID=UPI00329A662A
MMNGFGGMWFGWLIWIVIIAAVVWAFIQFTIQKHQKPQDNQKEDALEILKKRYAKGEISKEEFEKTENHLSR